MTKPGRTARPFLTFNASPRDDPNLVGYRPAKMRIPPPPSSIIISRAAHQLVQHLLHVPQPPEQLRILRQRAEGVARSRAALARKHARRRLRREQNLAAVLETHLDGAVGQTKEHRVLGAQPVLDVRKVRDGTLDGTLGTPRRRLRLLRRRRRGVPPPRTPALTPTPRLRSTALRPSEDRYPRKCRISFTFFSNPGGHGVDARKHTGGGATRLSLASAPSRRLARSRYSSRSPGAPSWHARCAVVVSGDAAWLSFAPPSTSSHAVSSADCVIFVASLNTTPKVPSESTYPSPYLLV